MDINDIIMLANNKEYLLLDDAILEKNRYFLAVQVVNDEPTNNYLFFKHISDKNDDYVEEVKEDNIKNALLGIFTINYSDMTEDYIKDNQL